MDTHQPNKSRRSSRREVWKEAKGAKGKQNPRREEQLGIGGLPVVVMEEGFEERPQPKERTNASENSSDTRGRAPRTNTNPRANLEHNGEHPGAARNVPPAGEHDRTVARQSRQGEPPGAEVAGTTGRKGGGADGGACDQGRHGWWFGALG